MRCKLQGGCCDCDHYCSQELKARAFDEISDFLNEPWPPPKHSAVPREMNIQFWGVMLTLKPDGTYYLSDTSGG